MNLLYYYYWIVIRNYCLNIYYYIRAREWNKNLEDNFLLLRLKRLIFEKLFEGFKWEVEICLKFEQMNPNFIF